MTPNTNETLLVTDQNMKIVGRFKDIDTAADFIEHEPIDTQLEIYTTAEYERFTA